MVAGLFILIICQLLGEGLRQGLHLPVPGPVIGMFLLAAILVIRQLRASPRRAVDDSGPDTPLGRSAQALIGHMGLLFVPAGAGIVAQADLLRTSWLPLAAGLVGSTILSLLVTALVMHKVSRAREQGTREQGEDRDA